MRYDSVFNNALDGLYRSVAFVSAVILCFLFLASPAQAIAPPSHDIWAKPSSSSGGNIGAGYTIHRNGVMSTSNPVKLPDGKIVSFADGKVSIKDVSVSSKINASVRAGAGAMKRGAVRCLTSFKCNVAGIAAGAGLEQLFDGLDWVMGEGGQISKKSFPPNTENTPCYAGSYCWRLSGTQINTSNPNAVCQHGYGGFAGSITATQERGFFECRYKSAGSNEWSLDGMRSTLLSTGLLPTTNTPVPSNDIDDAVNSFYKPNEKDWGVIGPWIPVTDPDLDLEITNLPRLTLPKRTRTIYDADGQAVEVEETNIWHDFDISANPSKNPQIKGNKTEEKKTFKDGVLTSTSTTTSSSSPDSNAPATPEAEQLTDCLFFPTLCEWLEWTREEPVEPTDDLSGLLKEVSVSNRSYTITGGAAACPAPLSLNLAQFGNREVSYQPLCDLASTMRPLYLALMAFLSALLIHRSINRV